MSQSIVQGGTEKSVTFRMSKVSYDALLAECGYCACSISGFVRSAVVKEIADRRTRRKSAQRVAELAGQFTIYEDIDAKNNA